MGSSRADQLIEAGLCLRHTGDDEGARRLFNQAFLLDPSNGRARQLLEAGSPTTPPALEDAGVPRSSPNPFQRHDPPPLTSNATCAWDVRSSPGMHLTADPGMGAAMDLVAADLPVAAASPEGDLREEVAALLRGAMDLLELDDHSGAIDLIAKAQSLAPADPEVLALRARSERTLEAMLESKLGKLEAVPRVKLKDDEIIWLNLDHRAGFVLAQIDGTVSFEDVFAVSGMSRLDTARILAQLIEEGIIGAR